MHPETCANPLFSGHCCIPATTSSAGLPAETDATKRAQATFGKPFENQEVYQAFEAAVIADDDAESAVERDLVLRLASVVWRLRRATQDRQQLGSDSKKNIADYFLRLATCRLSPSIASAPTNIRCGDKPARSRSHWNCCDTASGSRSGSTLPLSFRRRDSIPANGHNQKRQRKDLSELRLQFPPGIFVDCSTECPGETAVK